MARKKKTTTITEEIPDTADAIDGGEAEFDLLSEDSESLANVLKQFGPATVKIKVSKMTPKGAAYCFSTDEEIDEDFVQANYGGGKYACRIFINGDYKQTIHLTIADRLQPNAPAAQQTSGLEALMREQNAFLTSLLTKVLGAGASATHTPVGELTQAMQTVQQMTGGNRQDTRFEDFMKGLEFARSLEPGANRDWKNDLLDVVRDVAKPIIPIIAGELMSKNGGKQPAQLDAANPNQPVDITNEIRAGIAYLKKKALQNMDVNLVLDWIIGNAADYQQFLHVVLTTDFAKFAALDPEIGNEPYATWFKNLYDGLRSAFTQSNDVDEDTDGNGGDRGNVVDYAPAGDNTKQSSKANSK